MKKLKRSDVWPFDDPCITYEFEEVTGNLCDVHTLFLDYVQNICLVLNMF